MRTNILALSLLSCVASADVIPVDNFSVELLVGRNNQGLREISTNDTSTGIRGGYIVNENVTLELSYHDYGDYRRDYTNSAGFQVLDKASADSFNLGIKGSIPLSDGLYINGRLGISRWSIEGSRENEFFPGIIAAKLSDNGEDLYYGFGLDYKINKKFHVGLEYILTEMNISASTSEDTLPVYARNFEITNEVHNLSLSLGMKF